jgi:hypothetical protein
MNKLIHASFAIDKIKNPFSPGAWPPPSEMAGRGAILEHARVSLRPIRINRPEKAYYLKVYGELAKSFY